MNEYEQVRSSLIDMLEDLDDRLAKITHDIKEPIDQDFQEKTRSTEINKVFDVLGRMDKS
jgi:hypothetical protein